MIYLTNKRIATALEQEAQEAGAHSDQLKQKANGLIEVMVQPSMRIPLRDNSTALKDGNDKVSPNTPHKIIKAAFI